MCIEIAPPPTFISWYYIYVGQAELIQKSMVPLSHATKHSTATSCSLKYWTFKKIKISYLNYILKEIYLRQRSKNLTFYQTKNISNSSSDVNKFFLFIFCPVVINWYNLSLICLLPSRNVLLSTFEWWIWIDSASISWNIRMNTNRGNAILDVQAVGYLWEWSYLLVVCSPMARSPFNFYFFPLSFDFSCQFLLLTFITYSKMLFPQAYSHLLSNRSTTYKYSIQFCYYCLNVGFKKGCWHLFTFFILF